MNQPSPETSQPSALKGKRSQPPRRVSQAVLIVGLLLSVTGLLHVTVANAAESELSPEELRVAMSLSPASRVPPSDPSNAYERDPAARAFGQSLFFYTGLSGSGQSSCASCHRPEQDWAEDGDVAPLGQRSTPSLWNLGFNRWFNWDGSADSLWAQALGPIESKHELAGNRVQVVQRLIEDAELAKQYQTVFGPIPSQLGSADLPKAARPHPQDVEHPEHLSWLALSEAQRLAVNQVFVNIGKAIAAFEVSLVSKETPFDRYVEGLRDHDLTKRSALSPAAQRGLKLFVGEAGCSLCHSGANFSDGEFHKIYVSNRQTDQGRWDGINRLRRSEFNAHSSFNDSQAEARLDLLSFVVRRPETKGQFKTPGLRNVARTAPYMHNNSLKTLAEVVDHYNNIESRIAANAHDEQVLHSLKLSLKDKQALVAFLESLSDTPAETDYRTASR